MSKAPTAKKPADANEILRAEGPDVLRRQIDSKRKSPLISVAARAPKVVERIHGITLEPFAIGTIDDAARTDHLPIIRREPGNLPQCVDYAELHMIAAEVSFFQRGKDLVRPCTFSVPAANNRRTTIAGVVPVTATFAKDQMGRHIVWEQWRAREKTWVRTDAPRAVAETLIDRPGHWQFPPLQGVITTPSLRPDGTILSKEGYDVQTQLLLIDPPLVSVPQKPSRSDALAALAAIDRLLDEMPFVGSASRSVALSAILTAVCRGGMTVAPLHAASATAAGSGKSYLWDIASAIAVGQACNIISAGRDEAETEKRLVACVLAGYPLFSIDNVNGELGGDFLCQLTERPTLTTRILGRSEAPLVPNRMTVFATGNNIRLCGDMVRRALISQLDAGTERPELRRFSGSPVEKVLTNRGHFISAALTTVRAYIVAGRPYRPLPLGSYTEWSDSVRGALIWLGRPDPVDSMTAVRAEDPDLQTLGIMLTAWAEVVGTGPGSARTSAQVLDLAETKSSLREAIELTGASARRSPSKALGNWLTSCKGRIVGGRKFNRLSSDGHHAGRWYVAADPNGVLGVSEV